MTASSSWRAAAPGLGSRELRPCCYHCFSPDPCSQAAAQVQVGNCAGARQLDVASTLLLLLSAPCIPRSSRGLAESCLTLAQFSTLQQESRGQGEAVAMRAQPSDACPSIAPRCPATAWIRAAAKPCGSQGCPVAPRSSGSEDQIQPMHHMFLTAALRS